MLDMNRLDIMHLKKQMLGIFLHINQNVLCNIWKQTLKSELNILLTVNCNDTIDKAKILTILLVISK
jgi:hypothetical protein